MLLRTRRKAATGEKRQQERRAILTKPAVILISRRRIAEIACAVCTCANIIVHNLFYCYYLKVRRMLRVRVAIGFRSPIEIQIEHHTVFCTENTCTRVTRAHRGRGSFRCCTG